MRNFRSEEEIQPESFRTWSSASILNLLVFVNILTFFLRACQFLNSIKKWQKYLILNIYLVLSVSSCTFNSLDYLNFHFYKSKYICPSSNKCHSISCKSVFLFCVKFDFKDLSFSFCKLLFQYRIADFPDIFYETTLDGTKKFFRDFSRLATPWDRILVWEHLRFQLQFY